MTDEQQIRQLIDRWRQATLAGDLDTVLTLMTDDAVFLTPGKEPMTKDGFAAGFRSFSGRVQVSSTHDIKGIYANGDLAYCWSHITVVMTSSDSGQRNERAGHVLTVFRKSAKGWLLSRDANLIG